MPSENIAYALLQSLCGRRRMRRRRGGACAFGASWVRRAGATAAACGSRGKAGKGVREATHLEAGAPVGVEVPRWGPHAPVRPLAAGPARPVEVAAPGGALVVSESRSAGVRRQGPRRAPRLLSLAADTSVFPTACAPATRKMHSCAALLVSPSAAALVAAYAPTTALGTSAGGASPDRPRLYQFSSMNELIANPPTTAQSPPNA